jgi:dockerin type I repeat protein
MKKKSASQSAFFNLRLLIGLSMVLAGVFLALAGLGAFSALAASMAQAQQKNKIITNSKDPLVPNGFDCSKIHELGTDKQLNFRAGAIMIACGQAQGGGTWPSSPLGALTQFIKKLFSPLAYGGTDVDLITGTETYPNVTQSTTFSWANPDNPDQIVVAYNDSRGANFNPIDGSGASVSTDGGNTFTRLTAANGQSPFLNTVGDPVVLYNRPTGTWYTVWYDVACGGLGGYKSTTPWDPSPASWTHYNCVHSGSEDDRESGWSDMNPSSPFYGRMYVSWNDFARGGGALFVRFSTDNGLTWTNERQITSGSPFIRNVQITGDLITGDVYIAGMDEGGGGFPHNDTNYFYRSTDGGTTWTNTYVGSPFPGPGVGAVGYFAYMFTDGGGYWRHEGWGEPAAINGVVHYVYAQHGTGTDPGDVYYIRSTDMGQTFSAPLKLNSDATTRPQWEPNLSVSPAGTLLATWYDARESASCTRGNPAVPCYRMWARKSNDNGVSWLPDDMFSDVVSPLPAQPEAGIIGYVSDYDYGSALATKHLSSWVDGRVIINGISQQDAFTDRELVGCSVVSPSPACGSLITGTAPTDFIVNVTDPVDPATVHANALMVNGTPANAFILLNGNTTIVFHFNTSPVTQGLNTMHIPAGAFNCGQGPVLEFTCTFRYGQVQLMVTSTNPPVGGTFTPPAPGTYTYDVNFNIAFDPNSLQTSDLTLTGNVGATVTNVQPVNGNMTARFTLNIQFGGSMTASIAAGAITDQFGNPSAAFSGNYTVEGCPPPQYIIIPGTGTIVPGTADTGNHCDDCATTVALPFPLQYFGQTYNSVGVVSNGFINFVTPNSTYVTACLPATGFDYTIFPLWHDWRTDVGLPGCSTFANGCGIFTSVSGVAPNRIFNIEWHTVRFANTAQTGDFEVRLYENPLENGRFDVIYGTSAGTPGAGDTAGVQVNSGSGFFTQDFCNVAAPQNVSRTYTGAPCAPMAQDAFSRKVHGGAGTFDIPLPLTGNVGVECRVGPTYQMIIDFPSSVTVQTASVTSGTGMVSSFTGSGTSQITVNLSGVTDVQRITMTLHNVNNGNVTGDVPISMGVLAGDVNGNGAVSAADVALTKSQVGATVIGSNFREDVNVNGAISSTDVALVKSDVGHALPP